MEIGEPVSAKKVSCASRAGWCLGMLSISKLCFSSSTHGPSAHSKPKWAKMVVMRSIATESGCRWPCGAGKAGKVKSKQVLFSSSLICLAAKKAVFSSNAAESAPFKALPNGPATFLSSIEKSFKPFNRSVSAPLRPKAATRSSSTAAKSAAAAILALYSCSIAEQAVLNSVIVIQLYYSILQRCIGFLRYFNLFL